MSKEEEVNLSRRRFIKRAVKTVGVATGATAVVGIAGALAKNADARPAAAPIPTPAYPEKRIQLPGIGLNSNLESPPETITFEQLNRVTNPVESISHTGRPGNDGVTYTVESRKCSGCMFKIDLLDSTNSDLASTVAGDARSKGYTSASGIIVSNDQIPPNITMLNVDINTSTNSTPNWKVIGRAGGILENGKLYVLFEPAQDLGDLLENPTYHSDINFAITSKFLSATSSGGNINASTLGRTDIEALKNQEALRILRA